MLNHRLIAIGSLLACAAALTGCEDINRFHDHVDPIESNFAAGTPGEFIMVHDRDRIVRGQIAADGSVTCTRPYAWHAEFLTNCHVVVEDDGTGRWRLFAADSYTLSSEGRAYMTEADRTKGNTRKFWAKLPDLVAIEWHMQGYAPVPSYCSLDMSRRTYDQYSLEVDDTHDHFTCSPAMSVPDGSSTWALRSSTPMAGLPAGQQLVVLRSDSDFPLDVQVRLRLRHVLGTLRADASCPLPGFEGGQAIEVAAGPGSIGVAQQRVSIDHNLLAGEEGDGELLVRYAGDDTLGTVRLAMQAETATRRHELDALPVNPMVLGEGAWLRLLRMPSGDATLLAPTSDREPSLAAAFCWNDLVRVSGISAVPAAGTLRLGDSVDIVVRFDQPVDTLMAGRTAYLKLETGAADPELANVASSDPSELRFRYTVQAGDQSARLEAYSRYALRVQDGAAAAPPTQGVNLALPAPGAAGSLGASTQLVVDGGAP